MSAAKEAANAVHKRVCIISYRFPSSVVLINCHGLSIYHNLVMFNFSVDCKQKTSYYVCRLLELTEFLMATTWSVLPMLQDYMIIGNLF